jgi:hypothetical protein
MVSSILDSYTWDKFLDAYCEMNSTEFYGEKYPEFEEYMNKYCSAKGFSEFAVKALERGDDPQKCLDSFIDITPNCSRYIMECPEFNIAIIDVFIEAGAIFPHEKLFKPQYEDNKTATFEDEQLSYPFRGFLIDHYAPLGIIDVNASGVTWNDVTPRHWETLAFGYSVDGKNVADIVADNTNNDANRNSYLKYCSKYLKSL